MERVILHSDLNNFYASVECVLNPDLKNEYIAVCGNEEDRHGIVLAKNQKAKSCGVKTAETIRSAKQKCPQLVIVSPHFDEYVKYSNIVRQIYMQYTDMIEPFGIDECWLDVTGSQRLFGNGVTIAEKIRNEVKQKTGLTVSIGVSFNKVFAKLGSDLKKPDAVTEITSTDFKEKIWHLPANSIIGIGNSTYGKLTGYGIRTIGDLARTPFDFLKRKFGKMGTELWNYANGLDASEVTNCAQIHIPKSISKGYTLTSDLISNDEVWRIIFYLCSSIEISLRSYSLKANTVSVTAKNSDLMKKTFQTHLDCAENKAYEIAKKAFKIFKSQYTWERNVRSVTVCVSNLCGNDGNVQMNFFSDNAENQKREKAAEAAYEINKKYGKNSVTYASLLCDMKLPKNAETKFMNKGIK